VSPFRLVVAFRSLTSAGRTACTTTLIVGVAALVLLTASCGSSLVMRVPDVKVEPLRLAALPSFVSSLRFDDAGHFAVADESSSDANARLDEALTCRLSAHGARFYPGPNLKGVKGAAELSLWGRRTLREIWRERVGNLETSHNRVDEYVFDDETGDLQTKLRADYLLLTSFTDSKRTDKPFMLSGALAGAVWAARSERKDIIACVVRLRDGEIVWCNHQRAIHNVVTRGDAQVAIDRLLEDMLHESSHTRPEPGEPCTRRADGI